MLTELDYLLAADDATRRGALRYLDEEGRPLARTYPPTPRLAELAELRRLAGLSVDELMTELFRRLLFTILVSNNETRIARRITRAR